VVGVLLDDGAQLPAGQQIVLVLAQVQGDLGAAVGLVDGLDGVFAGAVAGHRAFPLHARVGGGEAGPAGAHGDLVGDDEGGIKADPELADQVGVLLLVAGQLAEELLGARLGDGTQVGHHLVAAHADAVVGDGQSAGSLVEGHADLQLGVVLEQPAVLERFETQLVTGIGGIRDQLAQKDLPVRIQRMNHEVQQLLHLGLEVQGLRRRHLLDSHKACPFWPYSLLAPEKRSSFGNPAHHKA
jgi:hypothetical protein